MNRKAVSVLVSLSMTAGLLVGVPMTAAADEDVQEITWMFWDDLDTTTDLISLGFKDTVDRFNEDYEGVYHVTPITTQLEEYYKNSVQDL